MKVAAFIRFEVLAMVTIGGTTATVEEAPIGMHPVADRLKETRGLYRGWWWGCRS